jgi:hypothetical protein
MTVGRRSQTLVLAVLSLVALRPSLAQDQPAKVSVQWDKVTRVSKTTPTLQVVVNPPLRRGSAIHDNAFKSLRDLQADYVRYVPWLPYPRLGVAALEPPRDGKTSWDFSLIDPMTIDFLEATKGHPVMLNFSTIPQWMVKTEEPVTYPADPDQPIWNYTQGSDFRDPSFSSTRSSPRPTGSSLRPVTSNRSASDSRRRPRPPSTRSAPSPPMTCNSPGPATWPSRSRTRTGTCPARCMPTSSES